LTGRMMDAAEAERSGLVSRIVPVAELIPTSPTDGVGRCQAAEILGMQH